MFRSDLAKTFRLMFLQAIAIIGLLVPVSALASSNKCESLFAQRNKTPFQIKLQNELSQFETDMGVEQNTPVRYQDERRLFAAAGGSTVILDGPGGLPVSEKMMLVPKSGATSPYPPEVKLEIKSQFPYPEFVGQNWTWTDAQNNLHQYRLVNVGTGQMRHEWPQVEKVVQDALQNYPNRPLTLHLPKELINGLNILNAWKKRSSRKATEVYSKRKDYLNRDELFGLREDDTAFRKNDDYFVLLKDPSVSTLEMTAEQFEENALGIVRLARMDVLLPSRWNQTGQGRLPVLDRLINTDVGVPLMHSLNKVRLNGKRIAEISRFVRLQEVPGAMMNALLGQVFETAINPQDRIDILVISVDEKTRRLFKPKYRFKDLARLNDESNSTGEYVMYLDTSSAEFAQTLADFRADGASIKKASAPHAPDISKWSAPWSNHTNWHEGGPVEKQRQAEYQLQLLREKILRDKQPHISWDMPVLSEARPKDLERVKKLTDWVASGEALSKMITDRLDSLTLADQKILFKNVLSFSTAFKKSLQLISEQFATDEKLLLVNDGVEPFQELIEPQFNGRKITVVTSQQLLSMPLSIVDTVVIFGALHEGHKTEAEKIQILNSAKSHLKERGKIVSFGKNRPEQQRPLLDLLQEYAEDVFKSGSPMSEKDFVLDLAQRRIFYEMTGTEGAFERSQGVLGGRSDVEQLYHHSMFIGLKMP